MNFFAKLKNRSATSIAFALGLLTFLLYLPLVQNKFIVLDDESYITQNLHVTGGLSWPQIIWAFKTHYQANWHPLTWISHMLDCQLFGVNPAGHHFTNILLHVANTLLLFFWLNRITGKIWRSVLVAAFFGWHPLHVESVAWAAERKDVLCAFFWLLTLLAYTKYVEGLKLQGSKSKVFYLLALFLFALSLMSKPMAVTLPFVLLLIDYWPLPRISTQSSLLTIQTLFKLTLEKIPFFLLTLADCYLTYSAQKGAGAVWSTSNLTFLYRAENAVWSYLRYISNTFWPTDLAIIYPYKTHLPMDLVLISLILLILWSALFIFWIKKLPYLFVGWFWFLGTLVPAIGIIQVGSQALADRYMYIPSIGLFILVIWSIADLILFYPQWKKVFQAITAIALAACLILTSFQISYWRNSFTLFSHAAEVIPDNAIAFFCLGKAFDEVNDRTNALILFSRSVEIEANYFPSQFYLGKTLLESGNYVEAMPHLNRALQITGEGADMEHDVGLALLKSGRSGEAVSYFVIALQKKPDSADTENYLADALLNEDKFADAVVHAQKAVALDPTNIPALYNLGIAQQMNSNLPAAKIQFEKILKVQPDYVNALFCLGQIFSDEGKTADAITEYKKVLQLNPNFFLALNNLAWIFAASTNANFRDAPQAIELAERACALTQNKQPDFLITLSAAYAEANQFPKAIATAEKARDAAGTNENETVVRAEKLLQLYKNQKSFHGSLDVLNKTF